MDRRDLLKLGAIGAGTAALSGCIDSLPSDGEQAASQSLASAAAARQSVESTGETKAFDLYLSTDTQQVAPSIEVPVWGFSQSEQGPFEMPGPTLRATAGDELRIRFNNLMEMKHTIHWHGVHLPWDQDGVPYMSQEPVPGGESFEYVFEAKPPGTHWYHCHIDAPHHIDMGMHGTLVFEDPEDPWRVGGPEGVTSDKVIVLDELDKNHAHNASAYANTQDPSNAGPESGNPADTVEKYKTLVNDIANRPPNPTSDGGAGKTNPAQQERDWYPDTYPAYEPNLNTYLLNGKSFPMTEPIRLKKGEAKRLRFVHAGMLRHSIHVHGHSFLVTHEDGVRLDTPYWKDTLDIAPGQRYDVILFGDNPGVWAMHEHSGHTSNHNIYPGGIFTAVAYEGFEDQLVDALKPQESGEYIRWYNDR
jgi:FtsP/CotA-like multicopper oxidase with cupredoxin domain